MNSELFVINCIQTFERARLAVNEYIPGRDEAGLLKTLQSIHRLREAAINLRVDENDVFEKLEQAIIAAFNRRPALKLTRDHVQQLLNADPQHALSKVLGCAPQDALQTLFSIPNLQDTLEYITDSALWSRTNNAASLLREILKPSRAQLLEIEWNANENNWEPIFSGEEWLTPAAEARLRKSETIKRATTSAQSLVELIEQSKEEDDHDAEHDLRRADVIRALGLLELRRRLAWTERKLYDQALEYAGNAAKKMPESPLAQMLLPILYIYQLGYFEKGLEAYLFRTKNLFELLPEGSYSQFEVDQKTVINDRPLIFSGQEIFKVANEQVGTFEIRCATKDQQEPQLILRAQEVPAWIYRQLEHDIPKLTPGTLDRPGLELHWRLLFTLFPVLEPRVRLLQSAVRQLGTEFFQAVALANENPIGEIPTLWSESLAGPALHQKLTTESDPLYAVGVEQLIARQQQYYGDALEIRRETPLSSVDEQEASNE